MKIKKGTFKKFDLIKLFKMIIFQNTRLRAHPVSLGLMEFRQFIVISSYLQEKREVRTKK